MASEPIDLSTEVDSDERSTVKVALPPDGTIVYVSPWRRKAAWPLMSILILIGLSVVVKAIEQGRLIGALPVMAAMVGAIVAIRIPMSGIVLSSGGVKARTAWWTYDWTWSEIDSFELREKGEKPRLRIHLRDGRTKGFSGFFAQTEAEEERGQELFRALVERLEFEHDKPCGRRLS